jgi:hypothetical protein
MSLVDRAVNVLAAMKAQGLGDRPICFVAHSMGGLLVKQMLMSVHAFAVEYAPILASTRGVVFIATPHSGADPATWVRYLGWVLRPSMSTIELESHSANLRFLNWWYRHQADELGVRTLAFFETRPTCGVFVVAEAFADPGVSGVTPIGVDADHICPVFFK